jgi:hypothetical protein
MVRRISLAEADPKILFRKRDEFVLWQSVTCGLGLEVVWQVETRESHMGQSTNGSSS